MKNKGLQQSPARTIKWTWDIFAAYKFGIWEREGSSGPQAHGLASAWTCKPADVFEIPEAVQVSFCTKCNANGPLCEFSERRPGIRRKLSSRHDKQGAVNKDAEDIDDWKIFVDILRAWNKHQGAPAMSLHLTVVLGFTNSWREDEAKISSCIAVNNIRIEWICHAIILSPWRLIWQHSRVILFQAMWPVKSSSWEGSILSS